jgi:hypothetical protein
MDSQKVNGYHLFEVLMTRVKEKKGKGEQKDYTSICHTLTDLNKNNAKIIYMLTLCYYIKESGVQPESLRNKKITFYNQKTTASGLGAKFNSNLPEDLIDLYYEFILMCTKNQ